MWAESALAAEPSIRAPSGAGKAGKSMLNVFMSAVLCRLLQTARWLQQPHVLGHPGEPASWPQKFAPPLFPHNICGVVVDFAAPLPDRSSAARSPNKRHFPIRGRRRARSSPRSMLEVAGAAHLTTAGLIGEQAEAAFNRAARKDRKSAHMSEQLAERGLSPIGRV